MPLMSPKSKARTKVTKDQISNPIYVDEPMAGSELNLSYDGPLLTFYNGNSNYYSSGSERSLSPTHPRTPPSASSSEYDLHQSSFLDMDGGSKPSLRRVDLHPAPRPTDAKKEKKTTANASPPRPWHSTPPSYVATPTGYSLYPKTHAKSPFRSSTPSPLSSPPRRSAKKVARDDDDPAPPPLPAKDRGAAAASKPKSKPKTTPTKLERTGSLLKKLHVRSPSSTSVASGKSPSPTTSPTKPKPVISNPIPLPSTAKALPEQGKVNAMYSKLPAGYDETCKAYLERKKQKAASSPSLVATSSSSSTLKPPTKGQGRPSPVPVPTDNGLVDLIPPLTPLESLDPDSDEGQKTEDGIFFTPDSVGWSVDERKDGQAGSSSKARSAGKAPTKPKPVKGSPPPISFRTQQTFIDLPGFREDDGEPLPPPPPPRDPAPPLSATFRAVSSRPLRRLGVEAPVSVSLDDDDDLSGDDNESLSGMMGRQTQGGRPQYQGGIEMD